MSLERKNKRLEIKLSSSIREINTIKRNFCIVRNVSRKGVFLTAIERLFVDNVVECIISFQNQSIIFEGIVRRVQENETGYWGYGIEIIKIEEDKMKVLEDFIQEGYLPELERDEVEKYI